MITEIILWTEIEIELKVPEVLIYLVTAAIRCEPLRPLINGTVLGNDMLFGAVVRYQCNVGLHLEGPETRTCQADGTWSDNQPTCSGEQTILTVKSSINHYKSVD